MNSLKKTPVWKKVLKFANESAWIIYPTDAMDYGIVKNKKSLQDALYLLKKKGYISKYVMRRLIGDDECYYEICCTSKARDILSENTYALDAYQPKKNAGIEIDIDGKTVFSMSLEDAYNVLEALKTISLAIKDSIIKG